jgi:hypothetical protein
MDQAELPGIRRRGQAHIQCKPDLERHDLMGLDHLSALHRPRQRRQAIVRDRRRRDSGPAQQFPALECLDTRAEPNALLPAVLAAMPLHHDLIPEESSPVRGSRE